MARVVAVIPRYGAVVVLGLMAAAMTSCSSDDDGGGVGCDQIADTMRDAVSSIPDNLANVDNIVDGLRDQAGDIDDQELRQTVSTFIETVETHLQIVIYLEPDLDEGDGLTVELAASLDADSEVERTEFESKEEAWQRFQDTFRDDPDLVEGTDPESVSASFRVTLNDPGALDQFISRYEHRDGVSDISGVVQSVQEGSGVFSTAALDDLRAQFESECESA